MSRRHSFALRPVSLAVCLLGAAPAAFSLPQGAVPTAGQTTVRQTAPGQLDIVQATQRAGIDWTSFSIAAGERVNIAQPAKSSVLLNRVVGDDPSLIYGALSSNGQVWLINPRGIVFGASSRVDVGGLVASTLSVTRDAAAEALASGRLQLGAGAGTPGELKAEGQITATDGSVVLVAPQLLQSGRIQARRVGLAAASEVLVDVEGDGLVFFNVRNDRLQTRLSVLGNVVADGGTADLRAAARAGFADTVLNIEGLVQARTLGMREGRIVIDGGAGGVTRVAGTLDASAAAGAGAGADGRGGSVLVQGEKILLADGARIDASGVAGGGSVRVGGDFQGRNAEVRNAAMVIVAPGATLDASATNAGDAGSVIVWSDLSTRFYGAADARGGRLGGNGGLVEVSGRDHLEFAGSSDRSAPLGTRGTLLLDPLTISIETAGTALGSTTLNFNDPTPTTNSVITNTSVVSQLGNGPVTLQAKDTIDVNAPVVAGGANGLTLQAGGNITVAQQVSVGGALSFSVNDPTPQANAVAGAIVTLNAPVAAGGAVSITNNGGTGTHQLGAAISGTTLQITGNAALTAAQTWTLNSGTSTVANIGGAFALGKAGGGTLVLSGSNAFSAVNVTGGTLRVSGGTALGDTTPVTLANATGVLLDVTDTETIGSLAGGGSNGGNVAVATTRRLIIGGDDTSTQFAGAITGAGTGAFTKTGAGVLTLTGTGNTIGGINTVSGGTLRVSGTGATASSGSLDIGATATLDIADGAIVANPVSVVAGSSISASSGTGTLAPTTPAVALALPNGSINLGAGNNATLVVTRALDQGANTAAIALPAGNLGTVQLGAANTYTGGTTVAAGTLRIAATGATGSVDLGANTLDITANASFDQPLTNVLSGARITSSAGNGTLAAVGGGAPLALPAGGTLNLGAGSSSTLTLQRVLDDTAGAAANLAVSGAGTVALGVANTYAGGTTVSGGATLSLGAADRLGTTSGITLDNGTLATGATFALAVPVTLNAGGGNVNTAAATTLTLSNTVAGTGSLRKLGDGALELGGDNSSGFSGGARVSAGTLRLAGGNALRDSVVVTLDDAAGAVLDLTAGETIGGLTGGGGTGGNITLSSGATPLTLTVADATDRSYGGAISNTGAGGGALAKTGAGVLTLANGTSSYTGGTSVSGSGAVSIAAAGALGTGGLALDGGRLVATADIAFNRAVTLGSGGGTFDVAATRTLTLQQAVGGAGGLTKSGGTGTLQLAADNSAGYAGTTLISAGTLELTGSGTVGPGAVTNNAALKVNRTGTVTFNQAISGTGSVEQANAGGTTVLAVNNSYGNTVISAGTLQVGTGGTVGSLGSGSVTLTGTLRISRSDEVTIANLGGAGALDQAGTGTTVLSGTANTYGGGTTVSDGTLRVAGTGATAGTGTIAVGGKTLDITGGASVGNVITIADGGRITASSGAGTVGNNATAIALPTGGNVTLAVAGTGTGLLIDRAINGGPGSATLTTDALTNTAVTLARANGYDGDTLVNSGTLRFSGAGTAGSGTVQLGNRVLDLVNAATLTTPVALAAGASIRSSTGGGVLGGGSTLTLASGSTLDLSSANGGTLTVSRAISDAAGSAAVAVSAGTVALSGTNSYDGGTSVAAGAVLRIGAAAHVGSAGITLDGGTLATDTTFDLTRGVTLAAGGGTFTVDPGVTLTLSQAVGGPGALAKAGSGTLALSGTNNYGGSTTVTAGTLSAANGSALPDTSAVTLANAAGAQLSIIDNETIGPLAGGGASGGNVVITAGRTLTVGAGSSQFDGIIGQTAASAALAKAGAGTLTLGNAANSYAGGTTVSGGGAMAVNAAGALGTGALTLDDGTLSTGASFTLARSITLGAGGGTFATAGGTALTLPQQVAGAGRLTKQGTGDLVLTADNSAGYGGGTTIAAGRLELAGSGTLGTGAVIDNGVLRFNRATGTLLVAANISGSGSVEQAGAGTTRLTGINSYGDTSITNGTLQVGATTALGSGNVTVTTPGVLEMAHGGTLLLGGNVGGSGSLLQTSGTTVLTGSNTFGSATVNGGVLQLGNGGTTGSLANSAVLLNAGTLRINRSDTVTLGGSITGAGALDQAGSGTTVLTGTGNTYSGGTTISNGVLGVSGSGAAGTGAIAVGSRVLDIAGGASVANVVTVGNGGAITNSSGAGTLAANVTPLTLAAGATVRLASAGTGLTINRVVDDGAGSAGLAINPAGLASSGTVVLTQANTYDGGTAVTAGTLRVSNSAAAGTGTIALGAATLDITGGATVAQVVTVADGATLANSSGAGTLAANATPLALGAGSTLNLRSSGTGLTVARVIDDGSGSAAVVSQAGSVTLGANNTYDGGTTVSAGTLQLGSGGTSGSAGTGAITTDGTLRINRSDTVTIAALVGGSGGLDQAGTGTTVLTAANTYAGGSTVSSGTLRVSGAGATAGSGTVAVGSRVFDIAGGASVANLLTIGNGGSITNSSGSGTVAANVTALALPAGGSITLQGSNLTFARVLDDGAGTAAVTASGNVTLSAANTYDGGTTLASGTLRIVGATASAGTGTVAIGTGTLDIAGGATVANVLTAGAGATVTNSSGTGTLAANATPLALATGSTLNLRSDGAGLTVNRVLDDGAGSAAVALQAGTVTLGANNTYDGGTSVASGAVLRFARSDTFTFASLVSGAGSVLQAGTGTAVLTAANTYTGGTIINAGTVSVSGAAARAGSGAIAVGSGSATLDIAGGATLANAVAVNGGSIANSSGTGSLTGTLALQADSVLSSAGTGLTVSGVISGTNLGITKAGAGTVTLAATNTYTGTTAVAAGTLRTASAERIANASALTVAAGATFTLGGTETVGSLAGAGTVLLQGNTLVAGGDDSSTAFSGIVGAVADTGSLQKAGAGTLTLGGSSRYLGTTTASAGTLALGTTNALAAGSSLVVDGGTFALGAFDQSLAAVSLRSGAITGTGTLTSASTFDLRSGTAGAVLAGGSGTGLAKTTAGTVTLNGSATYGGATTVSAGTLALASAAALPATSAVTVSGGSLAIGSVAATAGTLVLTGGSIDGSGSLTAASYTLSGGTVNAELGTGTLTSSGPVALNGRAAAGTVTVNAGTLTLGAADRFSATPTVTVATGATLAMNNGESGIGTLNLSGTLAGSGTLTAGNYNLAGGTVNAALGAGTLASTGASQLNRGSSAATVNVNGGTLTTAGANLLDDSATVTVATGAVLALGGSDTVGSLVLRGRLDGTGNTLTAANYTLAGGTANANLGAGALDASGSSTLNGTSAAGSVNVGGAGSVLALGAANRLADTADVTVSTGATLQLAGADTVRSLVLAGTLAGAAQTLTATTTATLQTGALVAANLAAASIDVTGSAALAAANRLADGSPLTIAAGATLTLNGDDTVASLAMNGTPSSRAVLAGTGTLSAATNTIASGRIDANLGGPAVDFSGDSLLNGTAAANTVRVLTNAVLRLGSGDRLSDNAAVSVATGAQLLLNGDDTVRSLALAGTLGGTGVLSASSYGLTGGVYNLDLGGGELTSSGDSRLNGRSRATTLTVLDGTLTLGSAGRLTATPAVTVTGGATLALGGEETFGTLAGSGNVVLPSVGATAALNTGSGGDSRFDGVISGGGQLVKQGNSTFTLGGASTYPGTTRVAGGTLLVAGTLASTTIEVDAGTLALVAPNRLSDLADINVAAGAALRLAGDDTVRSLRLLGTLGGTGTLTAPIYFVGEPGGGGTVAANLGPGQVVSNGTSRIDGTISGSLGINTGTLTLGSAGRVLAQPNVIVATDSTLVLGGAETFGTLAGGGTVALGSATLTTGAGGDSRFDGVLSGSGGLAKAGSGSTFTLGGSNTYSGATTVLAGTLATAAAERLPDASAAVVNTGATLLLGGTERVASLTLAGLLSGDQLLNAATYTLAGGTVGSRLGAGTLVNSGGNSTLDRQAAAGTVRVDAGTLTLTPNGLLTAPPAVTVAPGGLLVVTGSNEFGSLAGTGGVRIDGSATLSAGSVADSSFGGVIAGTGTLFKVGTSTFTLAGDSTYTGSTRVGGGTLRVAGTLASPALQVDAGATLAMAGADRLADDATVNLLGNARMTLAGNETVGSIAIAGTLDGSGTLTATRYTLSGTANANLGTGTLDATGSASLLNGSSAAGTVNVLNVLTLGSANRLADGAVVNIPNVGLLVLNGNDTVATLNLAGTLGGSGTLSATRYAFDGGTANANLGAGALTSVGSSTLAGASAADTVAVNGGTLQLAAPQRFTGTAATTIAAGATLAMTGAQTLGSLAGSGTANLGSFTLSTGSAGNSSFDGALVGSGALVKQGASVFTLTAPSSYSGATTVAAGTLRLAGSGSLATSGYTLQGTLAFARSDDVTLAQPVAGTGGVEQAGSGRLVFAGGNKTYTGTTRVTSGELATAGAENLPDGSAVSVAGGARLTLAGAETLRSVDADGAVSLAGNLSASGDLLMRGAVTVPSNAAVTLAGQRIDAVNDGNRWGASLGLAAGGAVTLSSGKEGTLARALTFGPVAAAGGGQIDAGLITFSAASSFTGGTMVMNANAPLTIVAPDTATTGKVATGLQVAYAGNAVEQGDGSRISVASGATLQLNAPGGGSVALTRPDNSFDGALSVISGNAAAAWSANATPSDSRSTGGSVTYALQSRTRVAGTVVNVGGAGIVSDLVSITADRLATVGDSATIVARLPFDPTIGTATSLPALTLELTPVAFTLTQPYGNGGSGNGIRVNVGSQALGNRTLPLNAGYVTVLPRGGARGTTAVYLQGPSVNSGGYRFFFDGAGVASEIPVFYNGLLPTTPAVENSISATVAVSEGARKERFDESVRTENVALRLRAGVIAEVGPAPSATQGLEGIRLPATCPPAALSLGCAAVLTPR